MDDTRADRIEGKIDRLEEHLVRIDTTLVKQSVILDEHIKRTELNEQAIKDTRGLVIKILWGALAGMFAIILGLLHLV